MNIKMKVNDNEIKVSKKEFIEMLDNSIVCDYCPGGCDSHKESIANISEDVIYCDIAKGFIIFNDNDLDKINLEIEVEQ